MNRAEYEQPLLLAKNWVKWTNDYLDKLQKNPKYELRMQAKERAYKEMRDTLLTITKQHCAFCDNWPLGNRVSKPTIEHFRPKARNKFPELAYEWGNLFPCCHYCQEKGDKFDEKLLKPDVDGYDFYDYFEFDESTWEIKPTSRRDVEESDKERAEITIEIYQLNGKEEDKSNKLLDVRVERKRQMIIFRNTQNPDIDNFPYRFMFG